MTVPRAPSQPFSQDFLNKLETLRLHARRRYLGRRKGVHLSPRRGTSLEFADFRTYAAGDDPRTVDWGLYARTDRLYVKVFHEEEDLFGYLFVDASGSMAYPEQDRKFTAAVRLALALCYVVLSADDTVRLHLLAGERTAETPFYFGRRHVLDAKAFLEREPPGGALDLMSALPKGLRALRRPGKGVLISDLLIPPEEFESGLRLLSAANLDVLVIQVLGHSELAPEPSGVERLVDSESGAELDCRFDTRGMAVYLDNLERHRLDVRSVCHRAGVQYALYDTARDLEEFVLTELPALGLLRE